MSRTLQRRNQDQITWGRRKEQPGHLPATGWARDDSITAGKWARYHPQPVRVVVERFMEKDEAKQSHWLDRGSNHRGLATAARGGTSGVCSDDNSTLQLPGTRQMAGHIATSVTSGLINADHPPTPQPLDPLHIHPVVSTQGWQFYGRGLHKGCGQCIQALRL